MPGDIQRKQPQMAVPRRIVSDQIAADMTALDQAKREELYNSLFARKQTEAIEARLAELRSTAASTISARIQDMVNKENQS